MQWIENLKIDMVIYFNQNLNQETLLIPYVVSQTEYHRDQKHKRYTSQIN